MRGEVRIIVQKWGITKGIISFGLLIKPPIYLLDLFYTHVNFVNFLFGVKVAHVLCLDAFKIFKKYLVANYERKNDSVEKSIKTDQTHSFLFFLPNVAKATMKQKIKVS